MEEVPLNYVYQTVTPWYSNSVTQSPFTGSLDCWVAHQSLQKGVYLITLHGISLIVGLSAGTPFTLQMDHLTTLHQISHYICAGLMGGTPVAQVDLITLYWISQHAGWSTGTPVTLQRVHLIILLLAGNRTGISESSDKLLGFLSRPGK